MKREVLIGLIISLLCSFLNAQTDDFERINGLSLVSENRVLDSSEVLPIQEIGANWAAVIPFGFMENPSLPRLVFNGKWQWFGERIEGVKEAIKVLHEKEISVMLKPQLWVSHGVYTGEIKMNSEADWKKLEANYRIFILAFADVAQKENVEMLCIGTEMKHFVEQRPTFWGDLISEIRSKYSGKLTYAANWDDYKNVSFWGELDYIGVDAYFPISSATSPSLDELRTGWKNWITEMDSIRDRFEKPLLFTEFGYRSIKKCAQEPWDYSSESEIDHEAQSMALRALFLEMWNRPNFAGGFLWKWHPDHANAGGEENSTFTVQNKKSQEVVKEFYRKDE